MCRHAQTMTDATSILNCEVWQMGHSETDIEAALLKIYRTLLQEIENLLYRFLTSLFRRRLGILAAQGEGL